MKKVLILGCSITCGMPDNNFYSWAQKFAEISQCNVINMALGGASMQFISYCLKIAKEQYAPNYIIVQKTFPFRVTLVKEKFSVEKHLIRDTENYWRLDPRLREGGDILTVTPSNAVGMYTNIRPKMQFAKWYFSKNNSEYMSMDYHVYEDYLDRNVNFSFSPDYFKDLSGSKKTKLDKDGHLNQRGSDILAERVYNDIKRDLYKNLS